jgi:hypothetical protein
MSHAAAVLAVLLSAASITAAEPDRRPADPFAFFRSRAARAYADVPRRVLAFYYNWYGNPKVSGRWFHWDRVEPGRKRIGASTHYPAKGAYDSNDPAIIDHHIDLARRAGIDAFICTWWGRGRFEDKAFERLLARAKPKHFHATVYLETVPPGPRQVERAVSDLLYVLRRYGGHPAFLKQAGRPVIFVYGRVMGQVQFGDWARILPRVEQAYGRSVCLIADGFREAYAQVFDGVHTYCPVPMVVAAQRAAGGALARRSLAAFRSSVNLARAYGRIATATVLPGYDDRKIRRPGTLACRDGCRTYAQLWESALAADPDWVLITSFNEWHEGTEIEPSAEHGEKYIQRTAEYAKRFKQRPRAATRPLAARGRMTARQAADLRRQLAGKTLGVLPGWQGGVVCHLAVAGVSMRALSWADVLNEKRVSPASCPILLWAGGEAYTRTLREPGDVEGAIRRYLRGGGMLIAMPTRPLPFYYDEHKRPVGSAGRFGLPILGTGPPGRDGVGGWERPPADAKLRFRVNTTELPGLPASAPFPTAGDLRWRPGTSRGLEAGDLYVPLATLVDERGRSRGDGIFYVERRRSQPTGARGLYVWMRMADALPAATLHYAVFRFAAERLQR